MASIGQILEDINNSEKIRTGKQMRTKLYEFGKQIYEDAAKQGNANMEVADARGTFDTLNKRLNNSDTVKADKTEVQSEAAARQNADSNLQSQIKSLASGSPLVACSVDEMTDTKRIYVNTTDGHWYYHDGSTWADGGVYQSSGIGENAINKIITAFYLSDDKQLFNKDTAIKDKFVSSGNGNLYDPEDAENTYYASDYIEIKPNTPYVANDMSQQIAFYDENKTYISGKNYNNQYYTPWKSPQNAKYIRVTVKNNINNFSINSYTSIHKSNYKDFLNSFNDNVDIIFIDPPYKTDYIEKSIKLIDENSILRKNGLLILECDNLDKVIYNDRYKSIKEKKYGDKWIVILKKIV